jgi:histone H3/H4
MGDLPNAVVKRLRAVSATEEYIARLAREAQSAALSERRKTIMDGDIDKARAKIG